MTARLMLLLNTERKRRERGKGGTHMKREWGLRDTRKGQKAGGRVFFLRYSWGPGSRICPGISLLAFIRFLTFQ